MLKFYLKVLKIFYFTQQLFILVIFGIKIAAMEDVHPCLPPSTLPPPYTHTHTHNTNYDQDFKVIIFYLIVKRKLRWAILPGDRSCYHFSLLWSLFVRPSVNIFKQLLLWSRWANFAQISYGASLGWGNEKLLKWSRSVDQDGRHAHIW